MKPIKTEQEYREALERLNELFGAPVGAPKGDELDSIILLIDEYEKIHYPIEAPEIMKEIKTEEELDRALEMLEHVFDAPKGTPESDKAKLLVYLIDEYEKIHYPIEDPDPVEAARIRAEDNKNTL